MSKWIPVKTLPEVGHDKDLPYASRYLLMTDGENVYYGLYENDGSWSEQEGWINEMGDTFLDSDIVITHWMPLPEPPTK